MNDEHFKELEHTVKRLRGIANGIDINARSMAECQLSYMERIYIRELEERNRVENIEIL